MTTSRRTSTLPPSDAYSDLEIQKLSEFREKVGDILLTEDQKDDSFLIRWLRARNLDVTKAEEMLRSSLQWRQENDIDTILEGGDDVPEDLRERAPIAYCGISGEGYAVFVIPFGRHDLRYGLEKYGSEVMERCDTRNMEMLLKLMRDEGARRGRRVTQMIEIADSEGFSYRQMSSRLCREFIIKMQHQMGNHYPEVLRYVMIVNAPKIFVTLFSMLKVVIPKSTLEKVEIFGPDPEKWKAVVRQKFPVENIPVHWGGTLEGVDEYCSGHEMWLQGPKDMRPLMRGITDGDADFHTTTVNARDKFIKTVEVTEKSTVLEWKFKTNNHDIAFQVNLVANNNYSATTSNKINNNCATGSNSKDDLVAIIIVPHSRVDAHKAVQEGSHCCEVTGTYSFIFDNSFSLMKCKTLLYQVIAVDPEPEKFEDCGDPL
ncbi:putative SEC14-like protein 6 [Folsomia candida]|uniref:SEC14-like protein 2 n=1 Tax=Folsomia candida TaxID=158441 RepID=A0A226EEA1_FOLCA|nr:putative SEC14-like protein 6 [Folsomia candida]XP_021951546.1 putative SEC14-like protein 6 [Folsomia candida]XP_035707014.1 putative SEC14-like protein 6 [Folsomia candida]OXA55943.1 hypothetical protein Fcan01_09028 [Folsomia candida]